MIDYSQYCANSKDDRKLFNEVCGIYAFCYNSEIIYIGQSRHIGKRIYAHMSETKLERTIKLQERYENNGIIGCYKYAIKLYKFIKKKHGSKPMMYQKIAQIIRLVFRSILKP